MKNIKKFNEFINEAYDQYTHNNYNIIRSAGSSKIFRGISLIASIIEDLKNANLKGLKQSISNRSGFKKLEYVFDELGMLKDLKSKDDTLTFSDLYQYEFDSSKIIEYLNDEDTIEYIENDYVVKDKLEELDEFVAYIEEYDEWLKNIKKGFERK